jgi:hypothetical protein
MLRGRERPILIEMVHQSLAVVLTTVTILISTFGMFSSVQTRPISLNSAIVALRT